MRVEILAESPLLTTVRDLEALAAQVALERLARERAAFAATAGNVGDALGADVFRMHAARRYLAALPGAEGLRVVVTGDGDLATKDEQPGVEVVAVVGCSNVWSQAALTTRKPSRRSSASNSRRSIAVLLSVPLQPASGQAC